MMKQINFTTCLSHKNTHPHTTTHTRERERERERPVRIDYVPTPKALADFLHDLDRNDTAYERFLAFKSKPGTEEAFRPVGRCWGEEAALLEPLKFRTKSAGRLG